MIRPCCRMICAVEAAAPPKDPLGCVAIKKGQPIHIAYWMVVAGADSSLGIDTRHNVELAIADKGGHGNNRWACRAVSRPVAFGAGASGGVRCER